MENMIKKSFYAGTGLVFGGIYSLQSTFAADVATEKAANTFGQDKTAAGLDVNLEEGSLSDSLQTYVGYLMTFLYLIAVLYALWGGFNILTAGGDEEKVKKGKTILIQGAIGLLVIWLSGTIVDWVISGLSA